MNQTKQFGLAPPLRSRSACGMVAWSALVIVPLAGVPATYEVARPGNILCYYTSPVDGTEQPYFLYIPTTYRPSNAAPVVFSLHGFGGRTSPAAPDSWRRNWADSEGWILVNLDGRGSQNWDGIGEDDIFFVLNDLQKATPYHPALNLDLKRIYLEGCSMGGHGAFRGGFRYPDRFAAVAPGAGWTTYKEFYSHWYDATASPRMPAYVDPARLPVLETASSVFQTENARWLWTFITFDRDDSVNPPENHEPVIAAMRAAGSDRYATRIGNRGHCGSYCTTCNFRFFQGKRVKDYPADVVYTTNNLRYNTAYWVTIRRFRYLNQWARIEVHARYGSGSSNEARVRVTTRNVLAFSLRFADSHIRHAKRVFLRVDGSTPIYCPMRGVVHVEARLDRGHEVKEWSIVSREPPKRGTYKRPELAGPIGDAFRSRFLVIYGTRGGSLGADPRNPDWVAAQKFCTEWNQWTSLHWGGQRPSRDRMRNWWVPPYPFSLGAHIPARQPLVMPLPDTRFGLNTIPRDANLILFGDIDSNWIITQIAPDLPLQLASHQICIRERVYTGDDINYIFIAPNPFNADRYVVVSRGYLSSDIDPQMYGAGNVGKDLEALPFYWPDYVVWEADRSPAPTVQPPLKYLPETFLDAGYFGEDWKLDTTPPVSRVQLSRMPAHTRGTGAVVQATVTAADSPGGFGVDRIEWKLGTGPWQPYREPIEIATSTKVTLRVRSTDHCGQFIYDTLGTPRRGAPAPGNMESVQVFVLDPASPNL